MDENTNLKFLENLNYILYCKNLHEDYQFVYSESPNGFEFVLQEIKNTGQTFLVYDSNSSLPDIGLEEKWETGVIDFEGAVLGTIKHNIKEYINILNKALEVL
jgi:hypothetical protein